HAVAAATLNDRVDNRTAFSRVGVSEKEPVLFSESRRSNRVLHEIVVDFNLSILEINFQRFPLTQGITDRFADAALGQEAPSRLPAFQGLLDSSVDRTALTASIGITDRDARALFSYFCVDPVKIPDPNQHPC